MADDKRSVHELWARVNLRERLVRLGYDPRHHEDKQGYIQVSDRAGALLFGDFELSEALTWSVQTFYRASRVGPQDTIDCGRWTLDEMRAVRAWVRTVCQEAHAAVELAPGYSR